MKTTIRLFLVAIAVFPFLAFVIFYFLFFDGLRFARWGPVVPVFATGLGILLATVVIVATIVTNRLIKKVSDFIYGEKSVNDSHQYLNHRFAVLFENSLDVIVVTDLQGNIKDVNHSIQRVLGFRETEIIGKSFVHLFPPREDFELEDLKKEIRVHGTVFESQEFIRKDGSICPVDLTATLVYWGDEQVVLITLRDVSERYQLEVELQKERNSLSRRVDEQTSELRAANEELARNARMKDEFLASMSHELRTPLNSILGLCEALQDEVYGSLNDKQQISLQRIESSGSHLLSLINDILDLSKIEAGKFELEIRPVSVKDICQSSIHMIEESAIKKELEVSVSIDPEVERIPADERALKQILVNLLNNAVKFTPEKGKIELTVKGDRKLNTIRFTVKDTGIGISEEDSRKLFKPFVQLDSSLTKKYAGTGLGLSLVFRLAELQGGYVEMESQVGKGSRFMVLFPWHQTDRE